MTMMPCKDCPTRHPVCHDTCPKYAEFMSARRRSRLHPRDAGHRQGLPLRPRGPPPGAGPQEVHGSERRSGQMKVLIACEESQEVCKAFRAKGHEAYSCDIQEPSGGHPEWHILGDALKAVKGGQVVTMDGVTHDVGKWDLLIAHPPCTHLAVSGARWFTEGRKPLSLRFEAATFL